MTRSSILCYKMQEKQKEKDKTSFSFCFFVRVEGLEPPCLAAPDPKSGTSTNFATPA